MDGLLSMWREYGRKGNGAALVFNTQKVRYQPHSPLIIARVNYASSDERTQQLRTGLADWVHITRAANLPDDRLHLAAYAAFNFVKSSSLLFSQSTTDFLRRRNGASFTCRKAIRSATWSRLATSRKKCGRTVTWFFASTRRARMRSMRPQRQRGR